MLARLLSLFRGNPPPDQSAPAGYRRLPRGGSGTARRAPRDLRGDRWVTPSGVAVYADDLPVTANGCRMCWQFKRQLARNPEDVGARLVYADHLESDHRDTAEAREQRQMALRCEKCGRVGSVINIEVYHQDPGAGCFYCDPRQTVMPEVWRSS